MQESSWTLVKLARNLHAKFETDWRRLPADRRRAWARTVLLGIVAVMATLFVLILLLDRMQNGLNHFAWEESVLRAIEQGPITFGTAVWLQTFGTDFMLVYVVLTTAALAVWKDRPLLAVSILLSLAMMDAVVRIGWVAFERFRPALIAQGVASLGFHSFPSGHTSKTVAVYGLLAAQWFQASRSLVEQTMIVTLFLVIAVIVPLGRLRMGVHWPTDVIGGYVLGGIWLIFLLRALRTDRPRT